MPHSTTKNSHEIKLYYQLYFAKSEWAPKEFQPLTFDQDILFADDIVEDLQNRNLSDETIEQINHAIDNEQLYFKIYRDDEALIPENAFLLQRVRMLPNRGLLDLDQTIQNKIYDWTPAIVTQAVDAIGNWAWEHLPLLKINHTDTAQSYFSDSDEEDEIISPILSQESENNLKLNSEKKHSSFNQAFNTVCRLASYATQNPLKAMTWMLATQMVAASAMSVGTKSTSRLSSHDAKAIHSKLSDAMRLRESSSSSTPTSQGFIFPAEIDLSSLNGINELTGSPDDYAGYSVSNAGDVNSDGIADMIVNAGNAAYVIFGQKSGWTATLALSSLNGVNGFKLIGNPGDGAGISVNNAGDINGDGIADMVVGAEAAASGAGAAYVVFGQKSGWMDTLTLSNLNGMNGFKLTGNPGDDAGHSVSNAGDVNGDGIADMLVGTFAPNTIGAAYVVFGQKSGWTATLALSSLNGMNGFKLNGENVNDYAGCSVSNTGDVNGDGIADMLLGTFVGANSGAGAVYVVFGQKSGWPATLVLSNLNGMNGFKLTGNPGDGAGISVNNAGDINGDGIADILVGASNANNNIGAVYVVFGKKTGWPATLPLFSLNGVNGFKLNGENAGDYTGWSVSNAGDVNGDGIADMLVGAYMSDGGATYVIFGQKSAWPATLTLSTLNGVNGFKLTGSGQVGFSVSNAGDVNGDGIVDMMVGASGTNFNSNTNSASGAAYVVFGHQPPRFYANTLTTHRGLAYVLSVINLNVGGEYINIPGLSFTVETVQHGQFELVVQPGTAVLSFIQQQVWNGELQFVHDGSVYPPAYTLKVSGIDSVFNLQQSQTSTATIYFTPVLLRNQLTVNQNQVTVLNSTHLYAVYNDTLSANIFFNLTQIQHGQFYWTGTTQLPLTFFSQQNVTDGKVQFKANDTTQTPRYAVTVLVNGTVQTGAIQSAITYYVSPVLVQNNLIINQGQTLVLSQNNFYAADNNPSITPGDITFDFSSVQHGFFSFTAFPQFPVLRFSQQSMMSNTMQFTHDNGVIAPSYIFTITDKYGAQSHTLAGNIDFDVNPILVRNQLRIAQSQNVILSNYDLSATHYGLQQGNLIFNIANLAHGVFYFNNSPDVFLIRFYQDNISNGLVVFTQDGTLKIPVYQVSVSDGRINTPYQEADITWVTPTPSPSPSSNSPSSNSLDPLLEKGLISGGISGAVGFLFLVIRLYLGQRAQRKLNQMAEQSEGVGRELVDYRNNVIRPIARAISARIKITGCLEYIPDETMTDYLNAVETLVGELSRRGIQFNFNAMSTEEKHRIIHIIAQQTKQTLAPTAENNFCGNVFNFFCPKIKPDITPRDIEAHVNEITDRVLLVLQQGVNVTEDGSRELNALASPDSLEGDQHPEQRPLLALP